MDRVSPLSPRDLSVVVQGPVVPEITRRGLESIRTHLPGAQIILSTWEGADVRGLAFDDLVLSEDPGPIRTKSEKGANLNRLLWSTRQGLKKVERDYCLKFRTDLCLTGPRLLGYFGRYRDSLPEYKMFRERVVISSVLTWRATRFPSGLFHPSDMFGLGRTVDIRRWWSAPLYPFSARARFEDEPPLISEPGDGVPLNELAPEQYIWISALRRSTDVYLKAYPSPEDLRRELFFLINNFTVVEPARAEVEWLKGVEMPFGYQAPVIGHSEYRFLYRKWIEGRRLQVPPFSVAWKHLQLAMRKWTPDLLKPVWRFIKSFVLKSSRS